MPSRSVPADRCGLLRYEGFPSEVPHLVMASVAGRLAHLQRLHRLLEIQTLVDDRVDAEDDSMPAWHGPPVEPTARARRKRATRRDAAQRLRDWTCGCNGSRRQTSVARISPLCVGFLGLLQPATVFSMSWGSIGCGIVRRHDRAEATTARRLKALPRTSQSCRRPTFDACCSLGENQHLS